MKIIYNEARLWILKLFIWNEKSSETTPAEKDQRLARSKMTSNELNNIQDEIEREKEPPLETGDPEELATTSSISDSEESSRPDDSEIGKLAFS